MTTNPQRASRPHDAVVVELLKADPDFANEYLAAALEEAGEPGGQTALLAALRHVAEAQGEPPRLLRRLFFLRGLSYEEVEQVLT
ncbi:MAG: hypothetical protein M9919_09645 [Burkholderiaceae bacterium]|nr:hypothetical protein [Burkholderiaceae bacterium]